MEIDEAAFLSACIEIESDRMPPSNEASGWFRRLVEAYESAKQPYKHTETDVLGERLRNQISTGLESAIQSTQNTEEK